jgi:hypothetical protein
MAAFTQRSTKMQMLVPYDQIKATHSRPSALGYSMLYGKYQGSWYFLLENIWNLSWDLTKGSTSETELTKLEK